MLCVAYSFWTRKLLGVILLGAVLFGVQLSLEAGQNIMLTWNPSTNTDVAGYNIYYGTQSQVYTNTIPVGNVTNVVITNLTPGAIYYFSAKSYDGSADESVFSDETTFTVPLPVVAVSNLPPTLKALGNLSLNRNSGSQKITLMGITPGTTNGSPIKVTATSSNPNLINPTVNYTSPKSTGTLIFKPSPNMTGSVTITITVDNGGTNNNTVSRTFTVSVVTPMTQAMIAASPKIYRQPKGGTISYGKIALLTVGVSGRAPFHYQWKCNGTNLPGATRSFLYMPRFTTVQSGLYSVEVSNISGTTSSAVAVLTAPGQPVPSSASANLAAMPSPGNGQFNLQINGISGATYVVEASSDMKVWTPVFTNQSPFVYVEANPTAYSQRFYRAAFLPPVGP